MLSSLTGMEVGVFNTRKIFFLLLFLELVLLGIILFGDYQKFALYAGILCAPILIFLDPTIGLALMVITTSLDIIGYITSGTEGFKYLNITYFHFALTLTFLSTISSVLKRQKMHIPSANIWPPLLAFLFLYSISLIWTPDIKEASIFILRIIVLSLTVLMILMNIDRIWKFSFFVGILIAVPLVVAIITLYQFFSEGSIFAPIVMKMANALGLPVYRSTGTFSNPNTLACFLMAGATLAFGLLFAKGIPSIFRVALLATFITIILGLISSFSRGGWVSTMGAICLVVVFHKKWSYFGYFAIFLIFCLFIISIKTPQMYAVVFDRIGTIVNAGEDASSSARISLIKSSIAMWLDHPILGVGLRGFPVEFSTYIDPGMPRILREINEAHTIQFEILAETGIIGLTISTWLMMTVLFHGLRTMRSLKNQTLRCLQIGFLALFIGYIINFTFATDLLNNIFWMVIGMIYTIPLLDNKISLRQVSFESPQTTPG
ncbi:MAG: O-antigen ligase family protein [Candidatus Latescibacter sp.]|nr:O-antigen ligase family protein [Candidatus Latescibacter sp.]